MSRASAFWLAAVLVATLTMSAPGSGHPRAAPRAGKPGAAPSVLAEEKGKFRIVVGGQSVGREEFQIAPEGSRWVARGRVEVSVPNDGSEKYSAMLNLDPDGTPTHYEWSTEGDKKLSIAVDFNSGVAKMALRKASGPPFLQQFSFGTPRVVILDNNMYHQYAILARLYNWSARGTQTFPVLIPQDQMPGTITVTSLGPQTVAGATLEVLRVHSADLDIDLYLDSSRRLVRLSVPASKAEIVRE